MFCIKILKKQTSHCNIMATQFKLYWCLEELSDFHWRFYWEGQSRFYHHQCCRAQKISLLSLISEPGQGVKQDLAVSVSLPTQFFPPFIGGGWLHGLVLFKMVPPDIPHVWEHCVQGLQEPQLPSRGPAEIQRNLTSEGCLWSILHKSALLQCPIFLAKA